MEGFGKSFVWKHRGFGGIQKFHRVSGVCGKSQRVKDEEKSVPSMFVWIPTKELFKDWRFKDCGGPTELEVPC